MFPPFFCSLQMPWTRSSEKRYPPRPASRRATPTKTRTKEQEQHKRKRKKRGREGNSR
jgi:hypothetical protein